MLQHYVLRLFFVRCAKTAFLIGGLGVRYQTNRLREVAILLLAFPFTALTKKKYSTQSQGYLIMWKNKLESTFRCLAWP
jgi:hypothetical protein